MSRAAVRAEQLSLVERLRAVGLPAGAVGRQLRERYGVNARLAQRLARGWTQERTAAEWSTRWPDERKTFKNISYYRAATFNGILQLVIDPEGQLMSGRWLGSVVGPRSSRGSGGSTGWFRGLSSVITMTGVPPGVAPPVTIRNKANGAVGGRNAGSPFFGVSFFGSNPVATSPNPAGSAVRP